MKPQWLAVEYREYLGAGGDARITFPAMTRWGLNGYGQAQVLNARTH